MMGLVCKVNFKLVPQSEVEELKTTFQDFEGLKIIVFYALENIFLIERLKLKVSQI